MDPEERLGKTLFTARETGLWLLKKQEAVVPFGLSFGPDGDKPTTFFPRDAHPKAGHAELMSLVFDKMRARAGSGAAAIAMVAELHSDDGARAVFVHAEDREQGCVRFMYSIEKSPDGYRLDDAGALDSGPFNEVFFASR